MSRINTNCNGVSRRDFLQLGLGGSVGVGLTSLLRLKAQAASGSGSISGKKNVNCILVWLDGGPSHYETFDPKPNAPDAIRCELRCPQASVPRIHSS